MAKYSHDPLAVMLKVMQSPKLSKKEKATLFKWAVKETNLGRRKKNYPLKGWIPVFFSILINVITKVTN